MRQMFSKKQIEEISKNAVNEEFSIERINENIEITHRTDGSGSIDVYFNQNLFPLAFQLEDEDEGKFIILYYNFAKGIFESTENSDYSPAGCIYNRDTNKLTITPIPNDDYTNFNKFTLNIYSF